MNSKRLKKGDIVEVEWFDTRSNEFLLDLGSCHASAVSPSA